MMGTISVNMSQMNRFKVTSDNVQLYEKIMENGGSFFTVWLDRYIEVLTDFSIFFTATHE